MNLKFTKKQKRMNIIPFLYYHIENMKHKVIYKT